MNINRIIVDFVKNNLDGFTQDMIKGSEIYTEGVTAAEHKLVTQLTALS